MAEGGLLRGRPGTRPSAGGRPSFHRGPPQPRRQPSLPPEVPPLPRLRKPAFSAPEPWGPSRRCRSGLKAGARRCAPCTPLPYPVPPPTALLRLLERPLLPLSVCSVSPPQSVCTFCPPCQPPCSPRGSQSHFPPSESLWPPTQLAASSWRHLTLGSSLLATPVAGALKVGYVNPCRLRLAKRRWWLIRKGEGGARCVPSSQ